MELIKTDLEDLFLLEPKVFGDNRGYFFEPYNQKVFEEKFDNLIDTIQENPNPEGMIPMPSKLTSQHIEAIIPSLRERSKTLVEMAHSSAFFFKDEDSSYKIAKSIPLLSGLLETIQSE